LITSIDDEGIDRAVRPATEAREDRLPCVHLHAAFELLAGRGVDVAASVEVIAPGRAAA